MKHNNSKETLQHGETLWRLAGLIHYELDSNTHPETGKLYFLVLVIHILKPYLTNELIVKCSAQLLDKPTLPGVRDPSNNQSDLN